MKYLNTFKDFENIKIPLEIGDTIYGGRFKNKKVVVKDIDKDEYGDPTINGKPLLKFRTKKTNKKDE